MISDSFLRRLDKLYTENHRYLLYIVYLDDLSCPEYYYDDSDYQLFVGVRCPEIIVIIAVSVLKLGQNATQRNLTIFYILNCMLVSVGAISWITVTTNRTSKRYFSVKDNVDEVKNLHNYQSLLTDETFMYNNEKKKRITIQNNLERSLLPSEKMNMNSLAIDNLESSKGGNIMTQKSDRNDNAAISASSYNKNGDYIDKNVRNLIEEERMRLQPLIIALFATMFFSILQASFFAYVTSPVKGRDIEQILYFDRLFSDLLGRPLTRLCRSSYLKVPIDSIHRMVTSSNISHSVMYLSNLSTEMLSHG